MLEIWESLEKNKPVSFKRSKFVVLSAAIGGQWKPLRIERDVVQQDGCLVVKGFKLTASDQASEACRLQILQSKLGDRTVFIRGAVDEHSGFLLFVRDVLCERARQTGKAGAWEKMELRPVEHGDVRCFQLWSSQKGGRPVCFDEAKGSFMRKKLRKGVEPVTFVLQEFSDDVLERGIPSDADTDSALSFTSFVEPAESEEAGALSRFLSNAAQTLPPRLVTLARPYLGRLPSDTGISKEELLAQEGAIPQNGLSRKLSKDIQTLQPSSGVRPFELLEVNSMNVETGEVILSKDVVRGSTRAQTIRFRANEDLVDLRRVADVTIGRFIKTQTVHQVGTFPKREEPYEFTFPEESVPKRVPAISFECVITYLASNIEGPIHEEKNQLNMV